MKRETKFSAPYLNPTFSPPPFPHPTLFSWRGYSNGFPTGRVGLPKFYRDAFTIFLKRIFPLRDRMLKHCQPFLLHISFQVSHLILEKHPEKLLICCRQGTVCQGQHISHKNCKYTFGLHYLTARIER